MSRRWWAGAVDAPKKKFEEDKKPGSYQNVGLILGVTGIVGNSLAGNLRYYPDRILLVAPGRSTGWRDAPGPTGMLVIRWRTSNATSPSRTIHKPKLSKLTDVTHIF
ncbi:hypothetical protein AB3S75_012795 [Citrus x aurantiifolia]